MSKNQSIGPVHILLDDRYAKQLKPLRDAVIAGAKAKKPRGIFGNIVFISDHCDGMVIPCLTVVCPTHAVGKRFADMAKNVLGVKAKAK